MTARLGPLTYRDVRDLRRNPANARDHPAEQVEAIRASFRRFGVISPLLLKDDETTVGAGHGRLDAAELEGIEQLPTITIFGLTETEWLAYAIADNRLAEGSVWNEKLLKAQLGQLAEVGFDIAVTGFRLADLSAAKSSASASGEPPPPPAKPVTRRGDLWKMGEHLLLCGDSTQAEDVERVGASAAALCLTDPPYGIGYSYREHDDRSNSKNAELVAKVFALAPKAKVWTPGMMNLGRDINRFGAARMAIWHKGFAAAGNGLGGASTIEPVLILDVKRKKLANDHLDFRTDREELDGRSLREHHPCPKPVALFAHLVEAFCPARGRVYEPFSGSGTTLVACELVGRHCSAIEIDPAYVDVAILRWQAMTKREAVLVDGGSYGETKVERGV